MSSFRLEGVYPIVATPFRDDGAPDLDDLAKLVDWIVAAGVDGIVFPALRQGRAFTCLSHGQCPTTRGDASQ